MNWTCWIRLRIICFTCLLLTACGKSSSGPEAPPALTLTTITVNGLNSGLNYSYTSLNPILKFTFSAAVQSASLSSGFSFKDGNGVNIAFQASIENNNVVVLKPAAPLAVLSKFTVSTTRSLTAESGGKLNETTTLNLTTGIDSADKFPRIPNEDLLTLVQQRTFKYFWDFAHPASGMARERNTSGDIVTSGGSGFGIMAIITGIYRNFITRAEGLARLQKIVAFLKTAETVQGAFPHWLNGVTGKIQPFSEKDNGADLVETSFLMQGLLTARQFFNNATAEETSLRADINALWNAVNWSFFRKNNENVLYWHYSNTYQWEMNLPIRGWNECLITYVLAASSTTHGIPRIVYDNGWAGNGSIRNNNTYYNILLPLGPANGGPLFFAHYSFLGLSPEGLTDAYGNYWDQNRNHTRINQQYCIANPRNYYGYSDQCWGLTASDIPNGYTASSPSNDVGVIAPTAALSSFPYTPEESMKAMQFFYYTLGDKLWKDYGFVDAFSLKDAWFAQSFLAIDQGPVIVMIENYRSKLLWELFMSCPEIKNGLTTLGFQSPYL